MKSPHLQSKGTRCGSHSATTHGLQVGRQVRLLYRCIASGRKFDDLAHHVRGVQTIEGSVDALQRDTSA